MIAATVNTDLYGSAIRGSLDGLSNSVLISDGSTVEGSVFGARAQDSNLISNTVTINDSQVAVRRSEAIYGAYTDQGDVTGNIIDISNSTIEKTGDYPDFSYVIGGSTGTGDANANTITIRNSKVLRNADECEAIIGGVSVDQGNAFDNTVSIIDSEIVGNIVGEQSWTDSANGNTVEIENSSVVGDIYGGYGYFDTADGNFVTIRDEKEAVYGQVSGAWAFQSASGNVVSIDINGTVQAITGGSAYHRADSNQVFLRGNTHSLEVTGGISTGYDSTDSAK